MSLVEFRRYASSAEAHIVRAELESVGIPAFCFDTGMNLAEGAPFMFQVRVMVLDEDLDAARARFPEEVSPVVRDAALEGYSSSRRRRRLAWGLVFLFFGLPLLVVFALRIFVPS